MISIESIQHLSCSPNNTLITYNSISTFYLDIVRRSAMPWSSGSWFFLISKPQLYLNTSVLQSYWYVLLYIVLYIFVYLVIVHSKFIIRIIIYCVDNNINVIKLADTKTGFTTIYIYLNYLTTFNYIDKKKYWLK